MKSKTLYLWFVIGIIFLVACTSQSPIKTNTPEATVSVSTPQISTLPEAVAPYPPPTHEHQTETYPPPTSDLSSVDAYPPLIAAEEITGGPSFQLTKPILEEDTEISGIGPAGVPIIILDITFMGEILGEGILNSDGTFSIKVDTLEKGHRVGIALGNLEDTQWTNENFYGAGFNGDESMQVPMVGYFYDTTIVGEK